MHKNLIAMKTKYQVQSKFKEDSEWLEDHLPFDSVEEAKEYIKSQPVLPELAKTIHLYVLAAPNFTIKRISE